MSTAVSTTRVVFPQKPTHPAGSSEWWRDRLLARLDERAKMIALYEDYYDGRHKLAFATSKFREAFGSLFSAFADNWCAIVVDSSVERLAVEGFRFGPDDKRGDDKAWDIWQRNHLDAESQIAHTEAVKLGCAYLVVGAGDDGAVIHFEHPCDAITEDHPTDPRRRLAGLRRWSESSGDEFVALALPDRAVLWARSQSSDDWRVEGDEKNDLGLVPMVPLRNAPASRRLFGVRTRDGVSDLSVVVPLQDAINKLVSDMLVASEYSAFRQRWATGIEIPSDPVTGEPMTAQFLSAVSRMWTVEDEGARFGEFQASDLGNYVKAIEMAVQHLAAQTRTPPHYLMGQIVNASGDALKSAETGLVAKVRRKALHFGEDWEEVMRLAFLVEGDTERAAERRSETIWRDPETRSEGERVDALVKMGTLGVPQEVLWERWGASPQEISRWRALRAEEELAASLAVVGSPTDQGQPAPNDGGGGGLPGSSGAPTAA